MDEVLWLTTGDPLPLLLVPRVAFGGPRGTRLLALAFARRLATRELMDWGVGPMFDVVEAVIDGRGTQQEADWASDLFRHPYRPVVRPILRASPRAAACFTMAARATDRDGEPLSYYWRQLPYVLHRDLPADERARRFAEGMHGWSADLVRRVFPNPFRPVHIDPRWLTPTALGVAREIDRTGRFSDTAVLADALQDAGCDADELLAHLRSDGNVRGCWGVDLVLGRG
jgi:hypothetical protein